METFEKKLFMWARDYLCIGGRLTIIKTTLLNFPLYYIPLFQIPGSIAKKLEKIERDFPWEGVERKRVHLVKWEDVMR